MGLSKEQKQNFYRLLFPALIEGILIRLFHVIDSMMIGQMKNSTLAVAAVGFTGPPINLIMGLASGFFIGATAAIAWLFGAKSDQRVRNVAYQSLLIGGGIAFVLAVVSYFGADGLMRFVCEENDAFELAATYYRINAYGFFFQIITANITAIYRGVGISKLPMVYNLIGGGANVIFNYLLIFGKFGFPAMGLAGAAWATVISKAVSLAIAVASLIWKKSPVQFCKGISLRWDPCICKRMLPIGFTAAGEQALLQVGATISAKVSAGLPTAHVASNSVVSSMEAFAWSTGSACNIASTSLFGQAMGAGDEKLGKRYVRLTVIWAVIFAAVEISGMLLFPRFLTQLFTNDVALYPMIGRIMLIAALALPFINLHQTFSGALRSAGDTAAPLMASFASLWVFRVMCGVLLVGILGYGIYIYRCCMMVDQVVRCLIVVIFYWSGHWKRYLRKTA